MTKLASLLDQIDSGTILLPEFQRGYVWNRDQVRGLMRSLYRGYPVGSLLVWETEADTTAVRGDNAGPGVKRLLLDGQQRITSLYGVARGRPPAFFEGDASAFEGLRFHVVEENFEFYAPAKMADDPLWIDVTQLFFDGLQPMIATLSSHPDFVAYLERINQLRSLLDRDFHEEKITGPHMTVDVVVDIFNRVNSGGTKLSKGDLALAKKCADWPEARGVMRGHLERWWEAGYDRFSLDWLLRNVNAVATGRAPFSALDGIDATAFESALHEASRSIGDFLDVTAGRLGLDHGRVLMGHYAFSVVSRFLHLNGGRFADAVERDRMLFWYVHAGLWGRFAGSTETVLAQDFETVERSGIEGLIESLERWRGGNLAIGEFDFEGSTKGARFYPLLYLLTRVRGARDFGSGLPLHSEMLGHLTSLQIHHIFPKALLRDAGYDRQQINAVANFCFLTQATNLHIGRRDPEDYFAEVEQAHPGVLASQWIPIDPALWQVDRYPDFLAARRELLAQAANSFLDELRSGSSAAAAPTLERLTVAAADEADDARTAQITAIIAELRELGCSEPMVDTEIPDPESGRVLAVAEAYWPDGLQAGQGDPVVLELDPEEADLGRLNELGYEVFTSTHALLVFVRRRNEEAAGQPENVEEVAAIPAEPAADPALEAEFNLGMVTICQRARVEADYNTTYLQGRISQMGGLQAAKKVINASQISDGFVALQERDRLDLSVEALAIEPRFAPLFTTDEYETARRRLQEFDRHG